MPVIEPAAERTRIDEGNCPDVATDRLQPLLDSRPVAGMEVVAVNPAVNNPRNQGPELLAPTTGVSPL